MKASLIDIILVHAMGLCVLTAQEVPSPRGFVRVLHAVSKGTGNLEVSIDGRPIRDGGYRLGDVTGGVPVPPGRCEISFHREGVMDGKTRITVVANETTTLIPFAEATKDEPPKWEIKILRLKQHDSETERTATFVSVADAPSVRVELMQLKNHWEPIDVPRLGFARTKIERVKGYQAVRGKAGMLAEFPIGQTGNHVVVLHSDDKGRLHAVCFKDYKYLSTE